MRIPRRFTEAGKDVFSTVEWTTRTSRIQNPDGSVVFEMTDAQVPKSWSQLATDIMVSKYFRKAGVPVTDKDGKPVKDENGKPVTGPEKSARQVIHRLAGCWRHWGEKHGYFDTADDAQAFYDELAYMMLHQMCAPNSPQWFNTGLQWAYGITGPAQGHWIVDPATGETKLATDAYSNPQPHACFIQSIEDDLVNPGGIMDLWVREARLFKYGSGTGTNFSRLRGENEPLSGGGKSSGLMSFLKIGDRAAGAIKSGGTTRRAAKMVCLDLDHPDVEQFIDWKVREELKVAAMVEGLKRLPESERKTAAALGLTLDYDFNGEAYLTVSGQNSNNSVRIANDFFKRLDADEEWELFNRTDGKVSKRIGARALWEKIAYAAWRCADPGVQFDTTINQWHTCPASGRINASNPCVTGDTLVATSTGCRRIADLVGRMPEIINGDGQKVYAQRVFPTGRKPVYELRTRAGYRLRLTADHPVYTLNRGDVPAGELSVDDVVRLRGAGFGEDFVPPALGELLGAAVGDGRLTHSREQDFLFVSLDRAEAAVAHRLAENISQCKAWLDDGDARSTQPTTVTTTPTGLRVGTSVERLLTRLRRLAVLDTGSADKRFTDVVFTLDRASQAAILRGLFTTDGTVADYGEKSRYVALDSTSLELLRQVQLMLLSFGIKAKLYENRRALHQDQALLPDGKGGSRLYPVRQVHTLRISRSSRRLFEEHIGFLPESAKARRLRTLNERVQTYRDDLTDTVASLTPLGQEDVFDLTEPVSHHFVANGIVVHNCSEYMFLDNTACNLASLNLLRFYDPRKRTFDLEGYEHAIRLWTIVLEISVLMAAFPSREIARLSYEYRTLGLGYANIGAMLMQAGVPYDSDQARAICGALTAILTGRSYAASAEMAAQLGPFPGFFRNKEHMLRVIRNHRRAAYGVSHDADEAPKHELGDYEGLEIRPVPIDGSMLEGLYSEKGGLANNADLLNRSRACWDDALNLGNKHGYRNAQTTVIAPTGTIGLLMDCDTTGVEPDFALVKFKKLAGGGYFKIANQSLRPALEALGYTPEQIRDIMVYVMGTLSLDVPIPQAGGFHAGGSAEGRSQTLARLLRDKGLSDADLKRLTEALAGAMELSFVFNPHTLGPDVMALPDFVGQTDVLKALGLSKAQVDKLNETICGTGTVEGAPQLKPEHLPVFDCANKCGRKGKRFIEVRGHIRMMAAAQPFISGAISKTINLPNEATVEDIKSSYRLSWELGLKANALYRDGCKLSQVLHAVTDADASGEEVEDEEAIEAGKEEVSAAVASAAAAAATAATNAPGTVERIVERIIERPMRRRLPDTRRSITHKFNVAGHEGYLTVGLYDDGMPGELFITMAKEGSTIGGVMDSLGTAISVALQYGVPVESLVNKFTHQRFEPAGMTHNPDIPFAKSLVDYIFRWMGMEFIPGYRAANAPQRTKPAKLADTGETPAPSIPVPPDRAATPPAVAKVQAILDPARPAIKNHDRAGDDGSESIVDRPRLATRQTLKTPVTAGALTATAMATAMREMQADAPACDVCGTITVRSGTCYKCLNCGNSMGCS